MSHGEGGHGHSHSHSHSHHDSHDGEGMGGHPDQGVDVESIELSCTRGMLTKDILQIREAMRGYALGMRIKAKNGEGAEGNSFINLREFQRECGQLGVPQNALLSFYDLVHKRRPSFSDENAFPPPPRTAKLMSEAVLSAVPSESVEELEKLAAGGDAASMRKLGDVFNIGFKGVARDWRRGCKLYNEAADAGDLEALGCIQAMAFLKLGQEHPDAVSDGYPCAITPLLLENPTFAMVVQCMGHAAKMGNITPIAQRFARVAGPHLDQLRASGLDGVDDIVEALKSQKGQIEAAEARAMVPHLADCAGELRARLTRVHEAGANGTKGVEEIKGKANNLFRDGSFEEAEQSYSEALDVLDVVGREEAGAGELRSVLLSNRAECRLQGSRWEAAMSDLREARAANPRMLEAFEAKLAGREKRAKEGMDRSRKDRRGVAISSPASSHFSAVESSSPPSAAWNALSAAGNAFDSSAKARCEGGQGKSCIYCQLGDSSERRPLRLGCCCPAPLHPSCLGTWIAQGHSVGLTPLCPACSRRLTAV